MSTWILRRYVQDQISTNFHVISTNFFEVISLIEKSTSFPRTFVDVISMVEKSTLSPRTIFDVVSIVEKSTLFPRTFYNVTSMVEKSTLFPRTFSNTVVSNVVSSTVLLKFESYNFQHCEKKCCKLVFWVFTEQLHYQVILGAYIAVELLL